VSPASASFIPARTVLAVEANEGGAGEEAAALELPGRLREQDDLVVAAWADRLHEPPALGELLAVAGRRPPPPWE